MMSASEPPFLVRTTLASSDLPRSCGSTLRSVTGSSAGPLGPSAKRSTMPKGAAANFTSGGILPVAVASGNILALLSVRPAASLNCGGSSTTYLEFGCMVAGKVTLSTSESSASLSPFCSMIGATAEAPLLRRMPSISLRGTGALKDRRMGRIGRQAALAFSRSQLKSALKGCRTWYS